MIWTKQDMKFLKDNMENFRDFELAALLNKPVFSIREKIEEIYTKDIDLTVRESDEPVPIEQEGQVEYAVYYGDEFQCYGTKEECARKLGIKEDSFRRYLYRSGKSRDGVHIVNLGRWEIGG